MRLSGSQAASVGQRSGVAELMIWIINEKLLERFDRLANAQLLFRLFADHAGIPWRIPHKIDTGVANAV